MTILGEGFRPRSVEAERHVLNPMDEVLIAISMLRDTMLNLPAPVVTVEPQDLSAVVQAVQGLAGPTSQLTASDIADAVREVLLPAPMTESTPEWMERLLEALERIDFRMKASGVVSGGGSSSVTVQNQAGTALNVVQGQTRDSNNTSMRTSADGASQFVGAWTQTRDLGFVRILTVLASTVTSGLGGTFVFEFSEDGSSSTISETRTITDFATVRDFDLLNAGAYYRVKFTPSRALTGGEMVFISTDLRKQDDGAFVRLANQEIEEQNAALPSQFSYIKAFDPVTGKSTNVRADRLGALETHVEELGITESGSIFTESIRDDIAITFSRDQGASSVTNLLAAVTGNTGTATHDTTQGQVVFATGAPAGRICYFKSTKRAVYEPGHTIRGEQTIQISALPTGTQTIEWGYGEDDGAGNVLNGIGWGIDATGLYTWRRKAGVLVTQVRQDAFYDKLDGGSASKFRIAGTPVAFQPLKNSLFRLDFEWLGAAPPQYSVMTPEGSFIIANIEATVNQITGTTVPEPQLPLFVRVYNGAGGDLQARSGSWRGGIHTSKTLLMGQQPDGDYTSAKADGTVFVNTTTLGSSATFGPTSWFDSDGWRSIELVVKTNQISAANGLLIEFTDDVEAVTPITRSSRVYTFTPDDVTNGFLTVRFPNELDGFRVSYTNGGTAQSSFFIQCDVRTQPSDIARAGIESSLTATSSAIMSRSINFGKDPSTGLYSNITRHTPDASSRSGLHVAMMAHTVPTPIKADTGITGSAGTVTATPSKIIDITAVPTGATSVEIQAQKGNNQIILFATSSGNATSSNAFFELDAGQSRYLSIGSGLTTDIWAASATGSQGYRICWTFGGSV